MTAPTSTTQCRIRIVLPHPLRDSRQIRIAQINCTSRDRVTLAPWFKDTTTAQRRHQHAEQHDA